MSDETSGNGSAPPRILDDDCGGRSSSSDRFIVAKRIHFIQWRAPSTRGALHTDQTLLEDQVGSGVPGNFEETSSILAADVAALPKPAESLWNGVAAGDGCAGFAAAFEPSASNRHLIEVCSKTMGQSFHPAFSCMPVSDDRSL